MDKLLKDVECSEEELEKKIWHQMEYHRERLEQLQDSFEKLLEARNILPGIHHSTKYEVMIPIHGVAWMRGFLIHTNEVYVQLNDEFMVRTSNVDATSIVDRKIARKKAEIEELKKAFLFWKEKLAQLNVIWHQEGDEEVETLFEIREHVNDDDEVVHAEVKPVRNDQDMISKMQQKPKKVSRFRAQHGGG